MRFTLKNLRFLQYIDYQNVRKTEFLGCQSQEKKSILENPSQIFTNLFFHAYLLKFRKCETPLLEPARARASPFHEGRDLG